MGDKLRADASRNRERITCAALQAVIEHGAEAPMDEIARLAGVGNATVYRHFPDRAALLRSVLSAAMGHTAELAESALAEAVGPPEGDPVAALRRFVHAAVPARAGVMCALISKHVDAASPELASARERCARALSQLLETGRARGLIRPDVGFADLLVLVSQLTRPLPGAGRSAFEPFVHRHLDLLVDGIATPAPAPLPGHPATLEELRA